MDKAFNEKHFKELIAKNGNEAQIEKAIEELNELIVALKQPSVAPIVEEIADVECMIEQLKIIFNIHRQVEGMIGFKIQRTREREGLK